VQNSEKKRTKITVEKILILRSRPNSYIVRLYRKDYWEFRSQFSVNSGKMEAVLLLFNVFMQHGICCEMLILVARIISTMKI